MPTPPFIVNIHVNNMNTLLLLREHTVYLSFFMVELVARLQFLLLLSLLQHGDCAYMSPLSGNNSLHTLWHVSLHYGSVHNLKVLRKINKRHFDSNFLCCKGTLHRFYAPRLVYSSWTIYSACENCRIITSETLRELSKARENYPNDIIIINQAWNKLLTENLCYKARA